MVFIESYNIITSLGWSTEENMKHILNETTGIKLCNNKELSNTPFQASLIDSSRLQEVLSEIYLPENFTRLEQLAILSISTCLKESLIDIKSPRTLMILSTTKGNISLLDNENKGKFSDDRLQLWKTAQVIADYFKLVNKPQTVSNACISGVVGVILGKRLIDSCEYDNIVIVGVDTLSKFVVSGFQSFLSLSDEPCKPFDKNRDGLSLGEGVGTIVLTNDASLIQDEKLEIVSGATSNDANHISGPSRTGEGLLLAIKNTLKKEEHIDFISAHGTATTYNDDMESVAISRANLQAVPVNSLKGYFGHTLGAAGIIETIVSLEALKRNMLIKTLGYCVYGAVEPINIIDKTEEKQLKTMLKLASGFGGCNAAVYFCKHD